MNFNPINIEQWERKDHYHYYMDVIRSTYSLTSEIDVTNLLTKLKSRNLRIYPVQIYIITTIVNRYQEFRMDFDADGRLGYWDEVYPSYTVFNKERETFSGIWTDYDPSFSKFYENCMRDIDQYSPATCFEPKPRTKANTFNVSSVPWFGFTALNFNIHDDGRHLSPIFTLGKISDKDGRKSMPVSLQVHHAVCDGFHIGRFLNALQEMVYNWEEWLDA